MEKIENLDFMFLGVPMSSQQFVNMEILLNFQIKLSILIFILIVLNADTVTNKCYYCSTKHTVVKYIFAITVKLKNELAKFL